MTYDKYVIICDSLMLTPNSKFKIRKCMKNININEKEIKSTIFNSDNSLI